VRQHGHLTSAAGLGVRDHACWAFADRAEFLRAGVRYLDDGRRLGQRLLYVGDRDADRLRDDLAALADRDALMEAGWLSVAPLDQVYDIGAPADTAERLRGYDALVDDALADGYEGLRVLAEVTRLLADPAGAAAHASWEAVADRYMERRPLSALCGYDRGVLPEEALGDVARVHPLVHGPEHLSPFRLYAAGGGLALEGEVDYFSAPALARAIRAGVTEPGETALDLGGLSFIDVPGVRALEDERRALAEQGRQIVLRSAPPALRRLSRLLDDG
jgi:anti-anti-sigma factor